MFEIQDAAKVITESADPEARIIFGTIHDNKLKKGEIKITVIASGFPESSVQQTIFNNTPAAEKEVPAQGTAPTTEKKGKIFNSVPTKKEVEQPEIKAPEEEDDDDDWGAVPAFLRRSKLK